MQYNQKVKVLDVNFDEVKLAFHQFSFIEYLTKFQPVRILKWEGIESGKKAHFKFWFLNWRKLSVCHDKYVNSDSKLSFVDKGIVMPMGINYWNHTHIVRDNKDSVIIEDYFEFGHKNKIIEKLIYPVMVFPIFIRRLTYKLFFKK